MSPRFAFTPLPVSRSEARKPSMMAALTGAWRGTLTQDDGATEAFTLLRDGSSDAAVAGRFLFFVTKAVAPTGVKLLEAAGSAFVALVGPYYYPREDREVVTVLEGQRNGGTVEGTFYSRVYGLRDTIRAGHFRAVRTDSADRAA